VALNYSLRIQQGETWTRRFPVVSDDPESDTIIGLVARAQVRDRDGTSLLLHEWSTTAGNLTVDATGVTLTVPAAVSSAWTWRRGVWALELSDPDTSETTLLVEGWAFVYPETVHD
jgi:hypothetical protein